jgi:CBS domain containing-hemolysin-like protein
MSDPSSSSTPRDDGAESTPRLVDWLRGIFSSKSNDTLQDALEGLIEDSPSGDALISAHERTLIANVLKLRDLTTTDLMVPRADIVAVDASTNLPDLLGIIAKHSHSRMPVYRDTLDDVIGIVHIKDVLVGIAEQKLLSLPDIVREVMFVAPSMRALDLLLDMRKTRMQMALVVDEYGGIDGLITIEDLLEGIVGEIEDEHDQERPPEMIERPDGSIVADARVAVEDFEEKVGPVLLQNERDTIETLGGLVFAIAGHVPGRGALLRHPSGIEFEVIDADPRRIKRLRVRNLPSRAIAANG